MIHRIIICCVALMLCALSAGAQDFDVQRFTINAQLQPAEHSAQIQARLALVNYSTQNLSANTLTLTINKRAKVTAVQVEGSSAQFTQKNDERLNELANVRIDLPKPVKAGEAVTVALTYTLEYKESTAIGAITPGDTVLLPDSFWVPLVHTPFKPYGPDIAPVTLTANGEGIQSDGVRNGAQFEQSVPAQPILLAGNYDEPVTVKAGATTFEIVYPRGIGANARKQAEALAAEGGKVLEFYNQQLGFAPPAQVRVVSSSRVGSYVTGTTLVLNEDLFRRDTIDLETVEFLARALLRAKIGGEIAPRGRGWPVMQDALPIYLAGLYFEQRYGAQAGREFFARRSRAYAPIAAAKTDGPLLSANPLDTQYASTMFNKGPLMLRIIEVQLGREKFLGILKELLGSGKKRIQFDEFRRLTTAANKDLTVFYDQWFDKIVEPDFIIGVPIAEGGVQKCALRNLGTGNVQVTVVAVTEKGDRLTEKALMQSQALSEVVFKTSDKIASVEIDPDKLYPQTNYDNDTRPQVASPFTLFKEANAHFTRKEYTQAEAKLRDAAAREPVNAVTRTLLARTLAAQGKYDEAKAEVESIWKLTPLPIYAITWTNFTLGESALAKGQKDAADFFHRAVVASKETIPARVKLIEAERQAARLPAVDESVRAFVNKLDSSIREGTYQALDPIVARVNLNKFMRGIVTNKPDSWTTEILRAEQITADRVVLDVAITAVGGDKREQRGTAIFILRRNQSGWILSDIELFNVQ